MNVKLPNTEEHQIVIVETQQKYQLFTFNGIVLGVQLIYASSCVREFKKAFLKVETIVLKVTTVATAHLLHRRAT